MGVGVREVSFWGRYGTVGSWEIGELGGQSDRVDR